MARVTRIERPTDLHPGTNGHHREQDETRRPVFPPDPPAGKITAKISVTAPTGQPTTLSDPWRIFGAVAICFAITLVLNTKSLVKIAEARPDGPARAILLPTAHGLDAAASAVRLDRLNAWIDTALGRKDEAPRFDAVPAAPSDARPPELNPTDTNAMTQGSVPTPSPDTTNAADTASAPRVTAPVATISAAGPPTPGRPRLVTTSNQLRVYVAGDSFVDWLGYDMADYGKRDGYLTTRLDSKISSGLARPDYFDWPARITQAMAGTPAPEAVIFFVGANDYTDMRVDSGSLARGTPGWIAEYSKRAANVMDIVGKGGAQMYWVGQPIMRDAARAKVAADINTAITAEAAKRPWVHYIDTWSMFTDPDGNYTAFLPDASGEQVRVRQEEGIHLTRTGTTWVSDVVYKAIRRDWNIR